MQFERWSALTPALSPEERENRSRAWCRYERVRWSCSLRDKKRRGADCNRDEQRVKSGTAFSLSSGERAGVRASSTFCCGRVRLRRTLILSVAIGLIRVRRSLTLPDR